jgi:hypothetical protein
MGARGSRAIGDHSRQLMKKDWQLRRNAVGAITAQLRERDCRHIPSQRATDPPRYTLYQ